MNENNDTPNNLGAAFSLVVELFNAGLSKETAESVAKSPGLVMALVSEMEVLSEPGNLVIEGRTFHGTSEVEITKHAVTRVSERWGKWPKRATTKEVARTLRASRLVKVVEDQRSDRLYLGKTEHWVNEDVCLTFLVEDTDGKRVLVTAIPYNKEVPGGHL